MIVERATVWRCNFEGPLGLCKAHKLLSLSAVGAILTELHIGHMQSCSVRTMEQAEKLKKRI